MKKDMKKRHFSNDRDPRRDKRGSKPDRFQAAGRPRTPEKKERAPSSNPVLDKQHAVHDAPRGQAAPLIWGLHAVREAWLNPRRRCNRLWLTESGWEAFAPTLAEGQEELLKRPDPKRSRRVEVEKLIPPGSVHQGIVLDATPLPEPSLSALIGGESPPDLLIMLDQVTDPHNIGAILRSAVALGAGGVIMTERHAPTATGVMAKAASGALEHVPLVHVVNLARALDEIGKAGYWRVGLAEEGELELGKLDLTGRTLLALGAEGQGLRHLTRRTCDALARLPTKGPIGSLNVSNAAAVALYEARRQKGRAS